LVEVVRLQLPEDTTVAVPVEMVAVLRHLAAVVVALLMFA
jgi:hypothetical protein